jgi:hypothetical protein
MKEGGIALNFPEVLGTGLGLFAFILLIAFLFHLLTKFGSQCVAVIKKGFSLRVYLVLTLILGISTTLFPRESVKVQHTPWQYQYGLLSNWITIYQPADYGLQPFWFHIVHGSLGPSVSPQNLFLDSLIIYICYLLLAALVEGYVSGSSFLKFRDTGNRPGSI